MANLTDFETSCLEWLNTERDKRDLDKGAKLMLQANRNKVLHQNVIRKSNFDKIEYELRKFMGDKAEIKIEPKAPASDELTEVETKVAAAEKKVEGKGKREDHDQLPDKVKALYEENLILYPKLRSLQEKLKLMSNDAHTPADRIEVLLEFDATDDHIMSNWEKYDTWKEGQEDDGDKTAGKLTVQEVQSHRAYLSRAISGIAQKMSKGETEAAEAQIKEAQRRYIELINDGQTISPRMIEKLIEVGIIQKDPEDTTGAGTDTNPPAEETTSAGTEGNTTNAPAEKTTGAGTEGNTTYAPAEETTGASTEGNTTTAPADETTGAGTDTNPPAVDEQPA